MKQRLKALWFGLLGKHPEAVVVSFSTGAPDKVKAMVEEVRKLIPDRRHFVVGGDPRVEGVEPVDLRALRRYRIGMAAVLFDGDSAYASLRRAAFLRAPRKILAYNANLERHHLQPETWLASLLFWCGVPLDRIYLRPRWLWWFTRDRTAVPHDTTVRKGRLPRPGHRRIGVLTPFIPYPLSHGGAVRLYHLLRETAIDYDVYLFAFRENEDPADIEPLLEFCSYASLVGKPRYREPRWATLLPPEVKEYESPPMRALLERVRREHHLELIQVEYTQLARYPGDILVEHDVTFDLYGQLHRRQRSVASWWNWVRWLRFERSAVRRYNRVVTMSEKDARLLGAGNVQVIPNGVDLNRFRPYPEMPGQRLLFIGSFRHFPNVTAFRFFTGEVWPRLRDRFPEMTVTVVAGPQPELYWRPERDDDRVRILGFVADVRPLYHEANIVLVPTLVSAGTNVKVLEAMAMERAMVTTTSGCGGIPVEHEKHVWIADGAAAFAEGIGRLASDPGLRRMLAANSYLLVAERFDWAKLGQMQRDLIAGTLPEKLFLRVGTPADLARVRQIQAAALPSSRWDAEQYLRHEFLVACYDGVIAGFIVARKTAPDEREVLNIAVLPEYRSLGIGEALLRALVFSGETGDVFLEVRESNDVARRLYERVGFEDVGRRPGYYEDPPETAVIMRIAVTGADRSLHEGATPAGRRSERRK
ncbi:MAG: ribosomal protein S18-alanine N-acetyltransferase [Bryobacterales bacterium]|nr:ribosomal protein S18-alanine N-acetyltransferase [Bryobacterales bacterium]